MKLELRANNAQIDGALQRLAQAAVNTSPLMRQIAGIMHDEVEENFAQEGRPKWMGLSPKTLTLGSNGAIKQAARSGLGVSLLSRAAVEPELAAGWLGEITLTDGPAPRPWFVLRSAVGPAHAPAVAFTEFVRAEAPDLGSLSAFGPYG